MKMSSQPLTIEVFLSDSVEEYTPHASTGPNLTRPSISVVIPVFNSAGTLESLVSRLVPVLSQAASSWEMIMVNDGSQDQSWQRIEALAASNPGVHGINLMRNYGQHNALLCGIREASKDLIVTIDDDLQNPPEEIPRLLETLGTEYDVVYGAPKHEQHGLLRDIASQVTKIALQGSMGAETARNISAFRVFRTKVRDGFKSYRGPFVSIDVLLTWGTTRFKAIQVNHDPRRVGVSNYTFRKLMTHALNMMTGFSTLPLQLASWIGFGLSFFGILVLAYVIGRFLIMGGSVPGFPFLASIIAVFSGAQLFALGIIGEYLARMHFRTMDRPAYVVRDGAGGLEEKHE
jgi:glycosyltransferase involved in cell wall biosynthesis